MITTEAIQNSILDSINEITQHAIEQAKFDKTVIGIVVECVDDVIGKYKIKYQDAVYYATAESTDKKYIKGTEVYILIPDGDFSKAKKIVGTVTENADSFYASINADKYVGIGVNCLRSKGTEPLVLNNSTDLIEIYENHYNFDETAFKNYLKNSNAVRLSAKFKTSGLTRASIFNYGLVISIKDKEGNILSYSFDTDSMLGTPYSFNSFSKQSIDLSIDSEIFESLESIFFFQEGLEENQSVACTGVELICLQKITTEENDKSNSMTLSLSTPLGSILSEEGTNKIRLEANVIYKGKLVNVDKIEAYWFKENAEVTIDNTAYNRYGGQGWECLNKAPDEDLIYEIENDDVELAEQKYKCVCIYNNVVLSQVISVYKKGGTEINLESSGGTYFKSNTGSTEIACSLNSKESQYKYSWSKTSAKGTYTAISSMSDDSAINIKVAELDSNTTIKCAVYEIIHDEKNNTDSTEYIGTASISLVKILSKETNGISIVVENSNQIFKYDAEGFAPNHTSLLTKQTLYPLTFKVYDENGKNITEDISASWYVPADNTLLTVEEKKEKENGFYPVHGKELVFNIKPIFNINNINNIIELKITYLGVVYTESIKMVFVKDGMSGANGTGYYCDIVPVDNEGNQLDLGNHIQPVLYMSAEEGLTGAVVLKMKMLSLPEEDRTFSLKSILYLNGEEFNGENLKYSWKILSNLKDKNKIFKITDNDKQVCECSFEDNTFEELKTFIDFLKYSELLIQATIEYQGKKYYKVFPVNIILNATEVGSVQWSGGTQEILYGSDGYAPQYSQEPLVVTEDFELGFCEDEEIPTNSTNIKSIDNGVIKLNDNRYNGLITNHKIVATNETQYLFLPIYFHLNTYGLKNINDWDGTSIQTKEGSILAPQIGAGKKDEDNNFTGMLMGTVINNGTREEKTGLVGYYKGEQSLFLNAEDGSAFFGKNKEIQLMPENNIQVKIGGWNVEKNCLWLQSADCKFTEGNKAFDQEGTIFLGLLDEGTTPAFSLGKGLIYYDGKEFRVDLSGEESTTKTEVTISTGLIGGWNAKEDNFNSSKNGYSATLNAMKKAETEKFPVISIGKDGENHLQIYPTGVINNIKTDTDILLLKEGNNYLSLNADWMEGINTSVNKNGKDIASLNDNFTSISNKIGKESESNTILGRLKSIDSSITSINDSIGSSSKENSILGKLNSMSGYGDRLDDIEDAIGNNQTVNSILGRIKKIEEYLGL